MLEKGEKEPLLAINTESNKNKNQQISEKRTLSWPQYICLNVIVFLFAAASVLDSNIIPLFIYGYFKNEQNSTNDVISNFSKFDGGGSKHVKCGMNTTTKIEDIAQSLSSTWLWYFKMTEYGCQAICLICAGLFTDIIGRKPIIFLALFGASVRFFLKGFIIYQKYDIRFFFVTYAIAGLSGSNAAFAMAVFALIADSTPSGQSRTIYLAIYDLVLGIGDGAVQLATGYLIQDTGYVIPCALSSGLCLFCACLSIASLPESVKKKNLFSAKESINRLFGFYHSNKYMKHGYPTWKFNLTMLIYVVFSFPMSASVNTLFEQGSPFCWTPKQIGLFSCVSMMALLVVGVALMRLLQYCITDETIGLLGCLSSVAEKMVFFLATSSWMLYIGNSYFIDNCTLSRRLCS